MFGDFSVFVHFAGIINVNFAFINKERGEFLRVQIFAILLLFAKIAIVSLKC